LPAAKGRNDTGVTAQQIWRFGAFLFAALGLVSAVVFARLRWRAGADFDVTGFFWLIQNVPRLTALVFCVLFFTTALWCVLRSTGSSR
jgi:hypothetical protein